MKQTKIESAIETVINVGSGMILAMCIWKFVINPLWGYESSYTDTFWIASIFTTASIIRGYYWRRFFNNGIHKKVHQVVKNSVMPLLEKTTGKQ